ncbi:MAG: hypothetical protein IJX43_04570 [Alphaproteobacteria bacterium]|nr:hypothetical protein [Alphaproteobacteria bacterium]
MNKKQQTQSQLITTSTGHQYVATYAGRLGDAQYFVCSRPDSGERVGTVATLDGKNFGPVCCGYLTAVQRARNVADARKRQVARFLFARNK